MKKLFFTALAIAVAAAVPSAAQKSHTAYASITTKAGLPAPGLGVNDITVREDNQSREVTAVKPVDTPAHIALLVDNSQVTNAMTMELRDGLAAFVQESLKANPQTQLSVMTFGDRPTPVQGFTSSADLLTKATGRTFPQPGSGAYFLDAIVETARAFKKTPTPRPIIVAFVDENGQEFSSATRQMATEALQLTGASLWVVALRGNGVDAMSSSEGRDRQFVIGDGSRESGGGDFPILTKIGFADQMRKVATLIATQYQVEYGRPDQTVPPKTFALSVTNKDLTVRAPHWTTK